MNMLHVLTALLTIILLLPSAGYAAPYPEGGGAKTIDELVKLADDSVCRTCHAKEYDEWKGTPHADPINLSLGGLRNFFEIGVKKEWNRKVTKNEVMKCLDCHSPAIRFASEELSAKIADMIVKANDTKDPAEKEALKKELAKLNVNCVSCHNLKATTIALGIRGEPKKGAVYGVYGKKSPDHETIKSAELKTSLFCMQCHGVYDAPDGESIQCNTLSESYQANYVARGGSRTCQDCHMKDKNRGHKMLGGRDLELVKEGIGFNVEVTPYRHLPKAPDTRWTPSAIVTVELTNNAGHRIPDGWLWSGEVVLDVTAKDKAGKELFTAKKKYLEIGADTDGDMRHGAWQIKQIFDLTLQPKDTKTETFLMNFNKETDEANIDVAVTYCLSGSKCDVIHKYTKKLTYTVDH